MLALVCGCHGLPTPLDLTLHSRNDHALHGKRPGYVHGGVLAAGRTGGKRIVRAIEVRVAVQRQYRSASASVPASVRAPGRSDAVISFTKISPRIKAPSKRGHCRPLPGIIGGVDDHFMTCARPPAFACPARPCRRCVPLALRSPAWSSPGTVLHAAIGNIGTGESLEEKT